MYKVLIKDLNPIIVMRKGEPLLMISLQAAITFITEKFHMGRKLCE